MANPDELVLCTGSGNYQMVDWKPDDEGYPGACVCLGCSMGVKVYKGSVKPGKSQAGFEGLVGKVRTHYIEWGESLSGGREPIRMVYRKVKK